jgi:hypothetical protein
VSKNNLEIGIVLYRIKGSGVYRVFFPGCRVVNFMQESLAETGMVIDICYDRCLEIIEEELGIK